MQLREGACKGRARWGSPGGLSRLSVLYAYEHPSLPDKGTEAKLGAALSQTPLLKNKGNNWKKQY